MNQTIHNLLTEQLASWETARNNYAVLSEVQVKELNVNGILYKVQFNPARIVSSGAKVDAKSIKERKCFLCPANLPAVQKGIPFEGHYNILVNPFPIFPRHLTVPETAHVAQRIAPRFGDMLDLARQLTDYTIFYNGPKCGASAPDHAHFQAGNKGFMPIEQDWRRQVAGKVADYGQATLWWLNDAPRTTLVIESADRKTAIKLFDTVYHSLDIQPGEECPCNVRRQQMDCICLSSCQASSGMLYGRRRRQPAEQSCLRRLRRRIHHPRRERFHQNNGRRHRTDIG